jgi:acetate kinase
MSRALISINAGSSSIKFGLYLLEREGPVHAAGGKLDRIGIAPHLTVTDEAGAIIAERDWPDGAALTHEALLEDLMGWADDHLPHHEIVAAGHRVVHGGTQFAAPVRIDEGILDRLEAFCPLAPLHQPHNLAAIRAIAALAPHLPQVACFDTAFHHAMPALATQLALPRALTDKGIRRYGFHGLSYDFIARRLAEIDPALAKGRVIVAHLGNGASMCAMHGGRSVDTTMGFTALDGLVMGSRSGSLDPGVVLHLIEQEGMTAPQVETMLYKQSGLLGVSGVSSDMRALHASDDPRAAEAIALFAWRAAREAGALVSSLGGIDGFVFTAGIGENDPLVRAAIAERMGWAGLVLDPQANADGAPLISSAQSRVAVRVIPTDEERMIALHTLEALQGDHA